VHKNLYVLQKPDEEGQLLCLNNPRAPKFKSFYMSFGWLDPGGDGVAAQHCVLLGGVQADQRILLLDELSGDITEVVMGAIELKDRYFVNEIFCDASDTDLMQTVWAADGLTRYFDLGKDPLDKPIWVHDSAYWPRFRDRLTIASIIPVPVSIVQSSLVGSTRLAELSRAGQLLIHSSCANVQWTIDQAKLADVARHPVFRALCYLVWGCMRHQEETAVKTKQSARHYQNLRKRK